MARIRTIKPEFWQHEDLSEVSEPALILAAGLLNHADDEGYFKARIGLIRAAVFPLREPSRSIPELLHELEEIGYVDLFRGADGKEYGHIVTFSKHQSVSKARPSSIAPLRTDPDLSDLPERSGNVPGALPAGSGKQDGAVRQACESATEPLPAGRNGMEGNGTGNGMEGNTRTSRASPAAEPPASGSRKVNVTIDELLEAMPGLTAPVAKDYLAHRRSKRAPLTATALRNLAKHVLDTPAPPDEVLALCMNRGWQGYESGWWSGGGSSAPGRRPNPGLRMNGSADVDYTAGAEGFANEIAED